MGPLADDVGRRHQLSLTMSLNLLCTMHGQLQESAGRRAAPPCSYKDTKCLQHEVRCLRKHYDQASDKVGSLREALRTARKCLQDRDKQLASTTRTLDRVVTQRDALKVRRGTTVC